MPFMIEHQTIGIGLSYEELNWMLATLNTEIEKEEAHIKKTKSETVKKGISEKVAWCIEFRDKLQNALDNYVARIAP